MKRFFFLLGFFLFTGFVYSQLSFEVFYNTNKFKLSKELKDFIKDNFYATYGKDYVINIVSYTDPVASKRYNQRLSELRAQQATEYVQKLVLGIDNIKFEGKGEFRPYDGPNEKADAKQRKTIIEASFIPVRGKEKEKLIEDRKNGVVYYKESDELMKAFDDLNKGNIPSEKTPAKTVVVKDTVVIKRVDTVVIFRGKEDIENANVGDAIIFRNINFKPDRAKFIPGSSDELRALHDLMVGNQKLKIEVLGHVCCGATENVIEKRFIDKLSHDRAKAVNDYLLKKGIEGSRIKYSGKGFSSPLIKEEKTPADEMRNRRVEIKVLEK